MWRWHVKVDRSGVAAVAALAADTAAIVAMVAKMRRDGDAMAIVYLCGQSSGRGVNDDLGLSYPLCGGGSYDDDVLASECAVSERSSE